jgi:tetratricopeptide (TPR) repeat protein
MKTACPAQVLRRTRIALFALAALGVSACSSPPKVAEPLPEAVPAPEPVAAVQQFDKAVTLLGAGDLDLAVREFKSLSAAYPEYSGPLVNLGIAQVKVGHLPEAEQAFKSAIERNPDNAAAFNQLGIVYRKLGRFADAEGAYQRALEISPDYALAHLNLGVLCDLYLQKPERALAQYERYVALTDSPEAKVTGWITELKSRLGASARTARADP